MRSPHDNHDTTSGGQSKHHRGPGHSERRSGRRHHRRGSRAPRGDVRAAVLQLLADEPMHGYQLMQAISDRTGGRWEPSPGTIYPTINQLEDEGLVTVEASSGRKLVSLTDAGRARVDADTEAGRDPFSAFASDGPQVDLRHLLGELHSAVRQVGRSGDSAQRSAAATILSEARRAIYLLLADGSGVAGSQQIVARAIVSTDSAERYRKQLASHLGRSAEVRDEAGTTRIVLSNGECLISVTDDGLELVATAATEEGLDIVTDVVGRHLERFGQRQELAVDWLRD